MFFSNNVLFCSEQRLTPLSVVAEAVLSSDKSDVLHFGRYFIDFEHPSALFRAKFLSVVELPYIVRDCFFL